MHFSKAQIAALVLGYLKSEKLVTAVEEFVKCCPYFRDNGQNVKMGKYFVTRVAGMTLVNFLEEYATIDAIVQSRLEETNFYETHSKANLIEQLLYLLDKEHTTTSSPLSVSSEVDTTPAHTLPGNSYTLENETLSKTPKKRSSRSRSRDREDVLDMTEVLTQSLLEHHELHEKIAETINIVRNTPEVARPVLDEHISAGASKELDAVIKTVIQRTEEDPVYNKFLNEIIGTAPPENPTKKPTSCNTPLPFNSGETSKSRLLDEAFQSNNNTDPIEDHNNDAIRSIIEVSQNTDPPPTYPPETSTPAKNAPNAEVIVFDGSLDTYLKTSGATATLNPNSVYLNPGLIVVPPPEPKYYIVNNQPLFKMNVPTMLTEKDLMSIPTIIVNDDAPNKKPPKRSKVLKPKASENDAEKNEIIIEPVSTIGESDAVVVTASETIPPISETETKTTPTVATRQASHVRNLDFSTPNCRNKETKKKGKAWDADLRHLVHGSKDKSPSPKRKRQLPTKKKKKQSEDENTVEETIEEEVVEIPQTPVKDTIPKTPGLAQTSFTCTPFNDVLEEQLKGVDLNSIPTPSIPITPGFALTPGDMIPYNQRSDYSTSSSYYQPSDTEQGKTISQLIEECREFESTSPTKEKFSSLKILSDVVIEQAKVTVTETSEGRKNCSDHLKKFNNNVIGKKNLSLINRVPTTSSSDSEEDNKTVVRKSEANTIKSIIDTVEVKSTLDEETRKRNLLKSLEEKRLRTIDKIKNAGKTKRQPAKNTRKVTPKPKTPKTPKKRKSAKKKEVVEETPVEETQDLVKGLAQRGIHLMPNKTTKTVDLEFDLKTYEDYEVVVHDIKKKRHKTYDLNILKKSVSVKVFSEDLNEDINRIFKWTQCECVLNMAKKVEPEIIDETLMDYALVGSVREESPEVKSKGGKKRKRVSEDDKQAGKKNKAYEELLKKINVDDFLDKVHGE